MPGRPARLPVMIRRLHADSRQIRVWFQRIFETPQSSLPNIKRLADYCRLSACGKGRPPAPMLPFETQWNGTLEISCGSPERR
jgi:hypothetical protein